MDKGIPRLRYRIPMAGGPMRGELTLDNRLSPLSRLAEFAFVIAADAEAFLGPRQEVTCRRGCSACCYHPVPVSPAEAVHAEETLEKLPPNRRHAILRRMEEYREFWGEAFGSLPVFHGGADYFASGLPCPFLHQGACSIHPHRPLACREHNVASDPRYCASFGHPFIRPAPPALPMRDALDKACARLLSGAPASSPLSFLPTWLKANPESRRLRFSERRMAETLLEELGGTIED